MAEIDLIKISELPATSTIGDADELAVVQGGATKKVPYSVLKDGAEVTPDTTLSEAGVPADAAAVGAALALKANQAAVTQALAAKADKTEVAGISGDIEELASVVERKADQTALNQKADKTTTDALRQDLTTLNGIVNQKADKTELNTQIGNVTAELATKANTADVNNLLAAKANVASPVFTGRPQAPTAAKGTATLQLATTAFVQNAIDDKQDTLTFDAAPTQGSTNPVTSGGVWEPVTELKNDLIEAQNDIEAAQGEIETLRNTAYIVNTASGDIAVFADGAAADAKSLVINIEPIQSGTGDPSPDNVRPISGRTGATVYAGNKNIAVFTAGYGVNAGGHISISEEQSATLEPIAIKDGIDYYYWSPKGYACIYAVWDGDVLIRRISGTSGKINTQGGNKLYVCGYSQPGTTVLPEDCMVTVNQIPVEYIAPNSRTVSVSWETEADTVYGGELDVVSGVLTVDKAVTEISENWYWYKGNTQPTGRSVISTTSVPGLTVAMSHYKFANTIYIVDANYGEFLSSSTSQRALYICASNTDSYTPNDFKDYIVAQRQAGTPIQILYELAEPLTYQLTPQQLQTLLGDNVIWSDAGSVSVDYRADTKLYIEQLTKPTEDDMTANTAIQSGKFFMIGNRLFISTAAIASGDTIKPGTNCTELSLADALNNLN